MGNVRFSKQGIASRTSMRMWNRDLWECGLGILIFHSEILVCSLFLTSELTDTDRLLSCMGGGVWEEHRF